MKHVGYWDGKDKVCLSYGYDQRDFTSLEPKWVLFKPYDIIFGTFILLEQKNIILWNFCRIIFKKYNQYLIERC